jgi:iron(II)-dependent oxidoreductase
MEHSWQTAGDVVAALKDARRRTLELVSDLSDEQLRVPLLPIINPIVWEIGHVGWFQERWALRHTRGEAPLLEYGDSLWDSAAVAHDTRWDLPLPSRAETVDYMTRVLDGVIDGLESRPLTDADRYFCWLAVMHEDMHSEALTYTRQTLGLSAPAASSTPGDFEKQLNGDAEFEGGTFLLGARHGECLVFDNEKWEHPVEVRPFAMARSAVTQGDFAGFVDDGGYRRPDLWSEEGWRWRERTWAEHPVYWLKDGQGWQVRLFDQTAPLQPEVTLIHVNWYEADAYCRWAGRRLPTESEWEFAAAGMSKREYPWGNDTPKPDNAHLDFRSNGCVSAGDFAAGDTPEGVRQMIGNAWEWTASEFGPYPGFVRDPYKEYSEPWFGSPYKVLRGGCWATRARLIRNTWRNFYTADRRDVFAGFRTCRL